MNKKYYVYMLRCEDNSIYTGITTDINRRFEEHLGKGGRGAKYTKNHKPIKIEKVFEACSRMEASKLEYKIKHLRKSEKEELIKTHI